MNRPLIIGGVAVAFSAAIVTVALADPVQTGTRNPTGGAATRETEIIARTGRGAYGTRQSNIGLGGGAIYGCRTTLLSSRPADPDASTACLRVNNLRTGKAFDFVFNQGIVGGIIQSGYNLLAPNPNAAPFITNATAIAAGLNADRVDGQHADQLIATARRHDDLDADTIDGKDLPAIVASAQAALVCPTGTITAGSACIETAARPAAAFADAAATCGKAGRRLPTAAILTYARTLAGVDLGAGELASDVTAPASVTVPVIGDIVTPVSVATVADDGAISSTGLSSAVAYRCATG